MKKAIFFLGLLLLSGNSFSQVHTDEFGKKVSRGNIALIVQEDFFSDGQRVSEQTKSDLNTATYAWVSKQLIDWGFQIVNRDDEAMQKVSKLLRESKSENYLDGLSIQAKGQGADYLLLVDMSTLYEGKNSKNVTLDYSYRFITIQNNIGSHAKLRTEIIFENENQFRTAIQNSISDNTIFFATFLRRFFPVQFAIQSMDGKNITLSALQPVGSIYNSDKLYFYNYEVKDAVLAGQQKKFDVINLLATAKAKDFKVKNSTLVVKTDKSLPKKNNIYAALSEKNTLQNEERFPTTVIGLQYDLNSKDGYVKKMVNQAVYCGLSKLPHFMLIESDMLPSLNKERELQKTEDFLNGHTVEQLKAMGAQYLVHISNFTNSNNIVSFTLSVLDVASNTIAKTFECQCHISNLDELVYARLKYLFMLNCVVEKADKKSIEVLSTLPIDVSVGNTSYTLVVIKPVTTPNGQTTYQRVEIARLKYAEYMGMKHRFDFDKILNKDEYNDISKNKNLYNYVLQSDDEVSDLLKNNSKFK